MGLGFAIGKALNLGTKFAIGAGAFDGIGNKISGSLISKGLKTAGGVAKDAAGGILGTAHNAGAGASLSDRLKGGMSAVSPTFASGMNVASQIKSRGLADTVTQQGIDKARQGMQKVAVRGLFGNAVEPGAEKFVENMMSQMGYGTKNPQTGEVEITKDEQKEMMQTFQKSPEMKMKFLENNIQQAEQGMKNANSQMMELHKQEVQKKLKELGYDTSGKTKIDPQVEKDVGAGLIEAFKNGSIDNPQAKTIQANMETMQKRVEGYKRGLELVKTAQQTELQEAQTQYYRAKGLAALNPKSGAFDAGTYAEYANSDDPVKRQIAKLARDWKRPPEDQEMRNIMFKEVSDAMSGEDGLRTRAKRAANSIPKIERMIELIETGKVTGRGGTIKAGLAGWAELLGKSEADLEAEGYSGSQLYQVLGRQITGPLRTQLIGGGQITEGEHEILKAMGGGANMTAPAARELLMNYITQNKEQVDDYNDNRNSLIELNSQAAKVYKKIDVGHKYGSKNPSAFDGQDELDKLTGGS